MKANIEDITGVKKKLIVEIDSEEIAQRVNDAYKSLSKRAKIPGFRSGKVPRRILESYYGEQLIEDLSRDLVTETLPTAVEETKSYPISVPAIEKEALKTGCNFKYTAVIEVKPQFELKDYMGLEIEKEIFEVTDEEVERQIEEIRKGNGSLNSVEEDRVLQQDDFAIIDYEGFEEGKPLDDIKADNFMIKVGSGNFHPDFEKALLGLKKEDTSDITVTFEEKYFHDKLAGKTVDFKVKVNDIKFLELPELTDEFVRNLGAGVEGLEELGKRIKDELTNREQKRVDQDVNARLLRKIGDTVEIELPESLVEAELKQAVESVKQNLMRSGSNLEKAGISEERIREDFRAASEIRVKNMFILGEVANQNDISVSEEELDQGFQELALSMGQDAKMVRSYYEASQAEESFREKLLEEKTLNYLLDGAKIVDVEKEKIKPIELEKA